MHTTGIFIFRRDLTIYDNLALNDMFKTVDRVIPIFILDPFQLKITPYNKNFRSESAIQFMAESLIDLDKQLNNKNSKLFVYYGSPDHVIEKLIKSTDIKAVGYNADFTKYSVVRDNKINKVCKKHNIQTVINNDFLTLHPIDSVLKKDGDPYLVFSSYYENSIKKIIEPTTKLKSFVKKTYIKSLPIEYIEKFYNHNNNVPQKGGRIHALKILKSIKKFKSYNENRDFLSYGTTRLSAYLKFGCVTIREVYHIFKKNLSTKNDLIKQLYWRTYYFILEKHYFGKHQYGHLTSKWKNVNWINSLSENKALWYHGNTGFPIIDACIRELLKTGYVNNRGRLLISNFAIKILITNPFNGRYGGQNIFSKLLVDNCSANNYGNWLWALGDLDFGGKRFGKAGTFGGRIIRDIIKFKRFDPNLEYVRKWIPELDNVPDHDVFNWNKNYVKYDNVYTKPIVNFDERVKLWYKLTKIQE